MGVQYLTAESIKKMYNKAPLFKIDQSRVNSLRNIYIRLQKKKKKYPSHRDNSTFAHFV